MGVILYNGKSSTDFGIHVALIPGYDIPEQDFEVVSVPGRNGDLHIPKNSYRNVSRRYELSFGSYDDTFYDMIGKVVEWLTSSNGYSRLEDSYDSNYFRLGVVREAISIENILDHAGKTEISFDCKPQKFLKSGENTIYLSRPGEVINPTTHHSLPLIKVYGSGNGKITVNNIPVDITGIKEYIVIDCDLKDAYKLTENLNNSIKLDPNVGFPKFNPGRNNVGFSGGITSVEVIPRWWTL